MSEVITTADATAPVSVPASVPVPANTSTSTPQPVTQDRKRRKPGSESSVDGDLSYLDLDTGRIQTTARSEISEGVMVTHSEFGKMIKKLELIESKFGKLDKLDKIDSMEQCIRNMSVKVSDLESRVQKSESATRALEQSAVFIGEQYDDIIKQRTLDEQNMSQQKHAMDNIFQENKALKAELQELRDITSQIRVDLTDVRWRSMRDNLLFMNIPEVRQPNQAGRPYEDTERVLADFLHDNLQMDNIPFERVHRITNNHYRRDGPRPIVAKFTFFKDREEVRRRSYMLRGTHFGINEQFPEEIESKRRELYPIARHFRKEQKRVAMVRDKLYVDGREIRADDVDIPHQRQPFQGTAPPLQRGATRSPQRGPGPSSYTGALRSPQRATTSSFRRTVRPAYRNTTRSPQRSTTPRPPFRDTAPPSQRDTVPPSHRGTTRSPHRDTAPLPQGGTAPPPQGDMVPPVQMDTAPPPPIDTDPPQPPTTPADSNDNSTHL